ncbi:MAG: gamma-glutamyltransferase [Longimicrobiales bacterium]
MARLAVLLLPLLWGGCAGPAQEPAADTPEGPTFPTVNRPEVRGTKGAVSSDHPLASAAGLDVLRRGGNAVDAAIAMAGVLAVVRPHMNGVGGDAFGLFYEGETGAVTALNGSGGAGTQATPEFFQAAGHETVPEVGPLSVSVPGAVAAWEAALNRYGTMPLAELLRPAIEYARDGFPVSTRLASDFEAQGSALNDVGREKYLPGGAPPTTGSLLKNQALATTLDAIATGGADVFYRSEIGARLAGFVDSLGGALTPADLAAHESEWVEPVTGEYLGQTLHVMPPNTQGITQIAYAEMAKHHPLKEMGHNSSPYLHTMIELKKLAFADRDSWVADPAFADVPVERLLDGDYLSDRATLVDMENAAEVRPPGISHDMATNHDANTGAANDDGDTVYLTAVDQWGNAVSWIQSLFHGFGSGLLEPETGVVLHNRGSLYTLQAGHPNIVAPGKRPYHTLTPLLATDPGGAFAFTLGTPGGDSQTQSLLQIMNNIGLFGMTPQAAIEAPRFRSNGGTALSIEDRIGGAALDELAALGHDIHVIHGWTATFGGAQMIVAGPVSGTWIAAADPRREAYALAY